MTTTTSELVTKAQAARAASRELRKLSTGAKNAALEAIAKALENEIPGAKLLVLDDVGHILPWEATESVTIAILEHTEGVQV
jgi:isoaspartyl peptidase/L-asparaginase-like protein (Ntn-hydrolase superfamily)